MKDEPPPDPLHDFLVHICIQHGIQTESATSIELVTRISKQLAILKADLLRARGKDPSGRWA